MTDNSDMRYRVRDRAQPVRYSDRVRQRVREHERRAEATLYIVCSMWYEPHACCPIGGNGESI